MSINETDLIAIQAHFTNDDKPVDKIKVFEANIDRKIKDLDAKSDKRFDELKNLFVSKSK